MLHCTEVAHGPLKTKKMPFRCFSRERKWHDKEFYLQKTPFRPNFSLSLCVFSRFSFRHILFAGENNSSNHTKDRRHQQNTHAYVREKGSSWKHKYNQTCLLCSNWSRILYFFLFILAVSFAYVVCLFSFTARLVGRLLLVLSSALPPLPPSF